MIVAVVVVVVCFVGVLSVVVVVAVLLLLRLLLLFLYFVACCCCCFCDVFVSIVFCCCRRFIVCCCFWLYSIVCCCICCINCIYCSWHRFFLVFRVLPSWRVVFDLNCIDFYCVSLTCIAFRWFVCCVVLPSWSICVAVVTRRKRLQGLVASEYDHAYEWRTTTTTKRATLKSLNIEYVDAHNVFTYHLELFEAFSLLTDACTDNGQSIQLCTYSHVVFVVVMWCVLRWYLTFEDW